MELAAGPYGVTETKPITTTNTGHQYAADFPLIVLVL
jgi:hypothetical protein